jgi:class 3 adenylate cyclase
VLATEEVHDAAEGDFDWSFAGRHRLKGVSDRVPLYRARRLDAPAPAREDRADGRRPAKAAARRAARRKAKRD